MGRVFISSEERRSSAGISNEPYLISFLISDIAFFGLFSSFPPYTSFPTSHRPQVGPGPLHGIQEHREGPTGPQSAQRRYLQRRGTGLAGAGQDRQGGQVSRARSRATSNRTSAQW
jgi:hypothetical protein